MDTATAPAETAAGADIQPEDDGLGAPPETDTQSPNGHIPPTEPEPKGETPEAGAELPDDGLAEGDDDSEMPTLFLTGDYEVGKMVKGRKPDTSVLKLKGGKIDLEGQFNRGDRLMLLTTVQVTGDNDQDTIEKLTGEVKSTSKAQSATVCGVARLEDFLRGKLEDHPEVLDVVLKYLDLRDEE